MNRCSTLVACLVAFALLAAANTLSAADAEKVPNPQYQQWKTFKVGAWSRTKQTITTEGTAMTMGVTTKLVELTDEKLVLEISMVMNVQGMTMNMPARKVTIPAMITKETTKPDAADATRAEATSGDETLTVNAKEIKCHWVQANMKHQDGKFDGKVWSNAIIPGTVVKMQGKFSSDKMSGEMENLLEDYSLGE